MKSVVQSCWQVLHTPIGKNQRYVLAFQPSAGRRLDQHGQGGRLETSCRADVVHISGSPRKCITVCPPLAFQVYDLHTYVQDSATAAIAEVRGCRSLTSPTFRPLCAHNSPTTPFHQYCHVLLHGCRGLPILRRKCTPDVYISNVPQSLSVLSVPVFL